MGGEEPTPENYTLLQGFEWNVPADGKHYVRLNDAMPAYKHIGISNIWLPPGCKASSPNVSSRPPHISAQSPDLHSTDTNTSSRATATTSTISTTSASSTKRAARPPSGAQKMN